MLIQRYSHRAGHCLKKCPAEQPLSFGPPIADSNHPDQVAETLKMLSRSTRVASSAIACFFSKVDIAPAARRRFGRAVWPRQPSSQLNPVCRAIGLLKSSRKSGFRMRGKPRPSRSRPPNSTSTFVAATWRDICRKPQLIREPFPGRKSWRMTSALGLSRPNRAIDFESHFSPIPDVSSRVALSSAQLRSAQLSSAQLSSAQQPDALDKTKLSAPLTARTTRRHA
jgi:hypothetical protein